MAVTFRLIVRQVKRGGISASGGAVAFSGRRNVVPIVTAGACIAPVCFCPFDPLRIAVQSGQRHLLDRCDGAVRARESVWTRRGQPVRQESRLPWLLHRSGGGCEEHEDGLLLGHLCGSSYRRNLYPLFTRPRHAEVGQKGSRTTHSAQGERRSAAHRGELLRRQQNHPALLQRGLTPPALSHSISWLL